MPKVPGLEKALENSTSSGGKLGDGGSGGDGRGAENEKQREEARAKKNVNRSLQRLKEQIKADKLRKRLEVCMSGQLFMSETPLAHTGCCTTHA